MQQPPILDKIDTNVLKSGSDDMTTRTLEIYQINNKRYVSPRAAATYLDMAEDLLQNDIYNGKLKADYIASHQLIDLDSLRSYAEDRRRNARGWDNLEAFRSKIRP
jgi:hypothetical protein